MTDATIATDRDHLEADIRRRMARLPEARGWDTAKARAEELAEIDRKLDAYNEAARG